MRCLLVTGAVVAGMGLSLAARAAEGGSSVYLQGTYGDFMVAVPGAPGFNFRNDLFYYDASIGPRPLGGLVDAGVDETLWVDVAKIGWVSDFKILGASFVNRVAIPIALDVSADPVAAGPAFGQFQANTSAGFGDPSFTSQLAWTAGVQSVAMSLGVTAPVGQYDNRRAVNLGRNYWAFDPGLSYTYLDELGWELSVTAGMMINLKNTDSNYTTGDEFHLDWLAGLHVSDSFALAITGYWYRQFTDDEGNIPLFLSRGFRGTGVGLGPAAMLTVPVAGHHVTFSLKWLHDLETTNRLNGDLIMLSFATRLGRDLPPPAVAAQPVPAPLPSTPPAPRPVPVAPDSDGDGVPDSRDLCPDTPRGERVDLNGCSCDVTVQVHFAFDSVVIPADDKTALNRVADFLKKLPNAAGEIGGYTDGKGSQSYNLGLSKRRAQAVIDYLAAVGAPTGHLSSAGYGEARPIGDNATETGRAMNRRVVLRRTDCDAPQ